MTTVSSKSVRVKFTFPSFTELLNWDIRFSTSILLKVTLVRGCKFNSGIARRSTSYPRENIELSKSRQKPCKNYSKRISNLKTSVNDTYIFAAEEEKSREIEETESERASGVASLTVTGGDNELPPAYGEDAEDGFETPAMNTGRRTAFQSTTGMSGGIT